MTNHTTRVLGVLLQRLPLVTNLALLHFMWTIVSGMLLPNRGSTVPALKAMGLSDATMRRAWGDVRS